MAMTYATPFTPKNYAFSGKGHKLAQTAIYPSLFGARRDQLDFEVLDGTKAQQLDFDDAIDRTIRVSVVTLKGQLSFTVQERFRRPTWAHKRDVTITEWNRNSNLPSELYKIKAMLFLYGYYDEQSNRFIEAISFHVSPLLIGMSRGEIAFSRGKNTKNQDFICIHFEELLKKDGLTAFHRKWPDTGKPERRLQA